MLLLIFFFWLLQLLDNYTCSLDIWRRACHLYNRLGSPQYIDYTKKRVKNNTANLTWSFHEKKICTTSHFLKKQQSKKGRKCKQVLIFFSIKTFLVLVHACMTFLKEKKLDYIDFSKNISDNNMVHIHWCQIIFWFRISSLVTRSSCFFLLFLSKYM